MPMPWQYQTEQPGYYPDMMNGTMINSFGGPSTISATGVPQQQQQRMPINMPMGPALGNNQMLGGMGSMQVPPPPVQQQQFTGVMQPTMQVPPVMPQQPMGMGVPQQIDRSPRVQPTGAVGGGGRIAGYQPVGRGPGRGMIGNNQAGGISQGDRMRSSMNTYGQGLNLLSQGRSPGGNTQMGRMYGTMGGASTWPGHNGGNPGGQNPFLGNAGGWRYGQTPGVRQGYGGYTGSDMPGVIGGSGYGGGMFGPGGGNGFIGGIGVGTGGGNGGMYFTQGGPGYGGGFGNSRIQPPGTNMGLPVQGRAQGGGNIMPGIGGGGGPVMGGGSGGAPPIYYTQGGGSYGQGLNYGGGNMGLGGGPSPFPDGSGGSGWPAPGGFFGSGIQPPMIPGQGGGMPPSIPGDSGGYVGHAVQPDWMMGKAPPPWEQVGSYSPVPPPWALGIGNPPTDPRTGLQAGWDPNTGKIGWGMPVPEVGTGPGQRLPQEMIDKMYEGQPWLRDFHNSPEMERYNNSNGAEATVIVTSEDGRMSGSPGKIRAYEEWLKRTGGSGGSGQTKPSVSDPRGSGGDQAPGSDRRAADPSRYRTAYRSWWNPQTGQRTYYGRNRSPYGAGRFVDRQHWSDQQRAMRPNTPGRAGFNPYMPFIPGNVGITPFWSMSNNPELNQYY